MPANDLSGLRVVVTGATGIAGETIRLLVESDCRVFVLAIEESQVSDVVDTYSGTGRVGARRTDLSDEHDAERGFHEAVQVLGGLDAVVAVAGGSGRRLGDGDISEMTLAAWNETLAMNLTTAAMTMRFALESLESPGSIVVVSSVLAENPEPRRFRTHAYAAAKGAINALVRSVAAAYADQGIAVNAVAPGLVLTPMSTRAAEDEDIRTYIAAKQPLTRGFLQPKAVAHAIVSLIGNPAITGQVLTVDGGWSVTST